MLPLSLLKAAVDHPMLIELKNGDTYNGRLVSCNVYMNICLKDVICTSKEGDRFWKLPECYIRGNCIKYLRIPDEIIDTVAEEEQTNRKHTLSLPPTLPLISHLPQVRRLCALCMAGVAGGLDVAREPMVLVEERRPAAAEEMDEVAEEVQAEEMGAEGGRAAATEEVGGRAAIGEGEEGVRAGGGAAERQPYHHTLQPPSHLHYSIYTYYTPIYSMAGVSISSCSHACSAAATRSRTACSCTHRYPAISGAIMLLLTLTLLLLQLL